MSRRRSLVLGLGLTVAAPLAFLGSPATAAPSPAETYDVNGDGLADLAVGAPFLTDGKGPEGGVAVLTASKAGLGDQAQVLTPASPGVAGESGGEDQFGATVASGDFDADGYADLAVGLPVAYRTYEGAGSVTVLYGSAKGLTGARSLELLQPGGPTSDVAFGSSLAAGDFDGDGRADLAVSVEDAVAVFPGSTTGLSQSRSTTLLSRDDDDEDSFGQALAVGDLDQDGRTDLAVASAGASVNACYGTPDGLKDCPRLSSATTGGATTSLAIGNVSGSSRPEIVAGAPYADKKSKGAVVTLSLSGPRASTTATPSLLTQNTAGVRGTSETDDSFGTDVALGDLDGDGFADLVVGAPGEDKDKGRVTVVRGGAKGYRTSGGKIYDQNTKGVPGKAEKNDRFGISVALLDHDGDGRLDLTVGARGENSGDGAITLLRGSGSSFTTKGARTVTLEDLGGGDAKDAGFGATLGR